MRALSACLLVCLVAVSARADEKKEQDPTKVKPVVPVTGKLLGVDFKLQNVELHASGALTMKSNNDTIFIFLPVKPGQPLDGRTFEYAANDPAPRPAIHMHIHSLKPVGLKVHTTGYTLKVEFGKEKDGQVPGKLSLILPEAEQNSLAGSFSLKLGKR